LIIVLAVKDQTKNFQLRVEVRCKTKSRINSGVWLLSKKKMILVRQMW